MDASVSRGMTAKGSSGHGLCSGTTGSQSQFFGARQSGRAEEANLVHRWRAAGLSPRNLHPAAWHRSERLGTDLQHPGRRHSRHVQHVFRRRHPPDGDFCAQHHAVYLGVHHYSVDDDRFADARSSQKGGRAGPQNHESIHTVPHRGSCGVSSVRHRCRSAGHRQCCQQPGHLFSDVDDGHAHRRHNVSYVAGRTNNFTRHRQRHLAYNLVRHRSAVAFSDRRDTRTRPTGRIVDRSDPCGDRDGRRCHRLYRFHGTRAAPPVDPVS